MSQISEMNLIEVSVSEVKEFNASVTISEQLERMMVNSAQSLAIRSIRECAERYNFDAEEAIRSLGLEHVKMERKNNNPQVAKVKAAPVAKPAFPLPYNGEINEQCCFALRQNNGLYTQCQAIRKGDKPYCKACQALADKSEDNVPEYGTIQQRQATDIFLYVDPKGRKPVAYTKVMKKFKVSMAQVVEEAGKFNIEIHDMHFVEPESETKRGRPKSAKEPKEPKGAKGRPKKAKKVLEIEGDSEDLFAQLVANAQNYESESDDEELIMEAPAAPVTKKGKTEEEREQERVAKEEEKAAKALKKQQEEEAKALKKQQEEQAKAEKKALEELIKQDKEHKRQQEKAEKEAKKAAEEEAKALKKQQDEEAKAAKALKKQQEEEAKAAKALKKQPEKAAKAAVDEVEQEPDVVKKIEVDGKKYLKSKKTGIIYDYTEYTQNGEQVVVGQWNEKKNAIDFKNEEESEEEYESDDE
jgi:hypothetical protein